MTSQANSVTIVNGSWTVPAVSGPSSGDYDSSAWIGIDGYGNQSVEQIGTEQDTVNGQPVYKAWWEMYSGGLKQPEQIIGGMTISPGDAITATVQYITSGDHAGQFLLQMTDTSRANDSYTTYQTSSQTQDPLAERSTAEWIMEAPSVNGTYAQMPGFTPVNFTNATAVIGGVSGAIDSPAWQGTALNLVSGGSQIDTTSALTSSDEGFSVTSNSGVGAQSNTTAGVLTSQVQAGTNDPQVIVVGRQSTPHQALQLAIVGPPPAPVAGGTFGLTVDVEDEDGDVVPDYDGPVTLSLAGLPGSNDLGGTLTVDAVNGVATFSGLSLSAAGTYTIEADAPGLVSASLGLTAATPPDPATQWGIFAATPGLITAGDTFELQAQAEDLAGLPAEPFADGPVTLQLAPLGYPGPGGTVLGTVTSQAGLADFSGLSLATPGDYTLWVSGGGLTPASMNLSVVGPVVVTPIVSPPVVTPPVVVTPVITSPPSQVAPAVPEGPHATSLASVAHSRKGLTSITVAFDEALSAISATNGGFYVLDLATKKRGKTLYTKPIALKSIQYDDAAHTVTLSLSKPTKGHFQLTVRGGDRGCQRGRQIRRLHVPPQLGRFTSGSRTLPFVGPSITGRNRIRPVITGPTNVCRATLEALTLSVGGVRAVRHRFPPGFLI